MVLFSLVAGGFDKLVTPAVPAFGIAAFEINDDGVLLSGLVVLLRKIISIDLAQAALLESVIIV